MRGAAILVAVLALSACGAARTRSPEDVARSWSAALDRNDNDAAAALFADGARVVQNGELVLATRSEAVRWNASLPCGGVVLSVTPRGRSDVLVVFRLTERPGHACDAPGGRGAALFRVRNGKIVLWHQTAAPPPAADGQIV